MASLNKVFLIGNLTRDPELRYTTSGTGVCGMRMAVNRKYSVNGEEREEVCYVDVDAFGRQAETCNQYLRRGSQILVEGRLRYDEWDDRETGKKRNRLQVIAERVQFMSPPATGPAPPSAPQQAPRPAQQHAPSQSAQPQQQPSAPQTQASAPPPPPFPGNQSDDRHGDSIDDIPF